MTSAKRKVKFVTLGDLRKHEVVQENNNMAMQTFNDELDEISNSPTSSTRYGSSQTATAAAPATTPKPQATVHEAPNPKAAAADVDNENCDTDFDDKRVYDRPGQLNQCRPGKGQGSSLCVRSERVDQPPNRQGSLR